METVALAEPAGAHRQDLPVIDGWTGETYPGPEVPTEY